MMESGKSAVTTTAAIVESKEPEAVRRAVKALRRLASSTDVGVSYVNYSPLVADVKTEVEDALSDIENASIKEALRSSLTEYEFASSVWQATWRTDFIEGDLRNVAVSRYGVQKRGLLKVVWRDDFLAAIWRQGRNKFEIANSLLAQTNTKNIDSDDSLAGAWKITIVKDSKSVEFDMTITKTVGGYSGVLRSTMGNSTPVQVNRDGNTITFSYSERQKKSLLVVDFRGSLENGKITGAIVFTQNGKGEDAPFTAVKL
ncbi:MAG: hypothetical protein LH614_21975 [Pyrinomonadaceae bacterium]|nr:hypothetical protein [Pyrinomonadaceae bacterium]